MNTPGDGKIYGNKVKLKNLIGPTQLQDFAP